MYQFEKINPANIDWDNVVQSEEATIYHTKEWFNFMSSKPNWHPFVIKVNRDNAIIGYFFGELINLLFIKIVGAPCKGAGAYHQGFIRAKGVQNLTVDDRIVIYQEIAEWLSITEHVSTLQVSDFQFAQFEEEYQDERGYKFPKLDELNISYTALPTYVLDLDKSEEELWAGLHYKSCKYCINKAVKEELRIKVITNRNEIKSFVNEHMREKQDVSRRHGRKYSLLTNGRKRILHLCETLFPDRVLMLQVIGVNDNHEDFVCASGIFCFDQGMSIYYSGCSYAQYQKLCPNELMVWEAIRIIHQRGSKCFNMIGIAPYKRKFGAKLAYVPRVSFTNKPWLPRILIGAKKCYKQLKSVQTYLRKKIFHYGR